MQERRHLERIEIEGFKSIKSLSLDLHPLNVLVGANGAGKSNFISLFRLLNEMVEGSFQLAVQRGGGADSFLHFGQKTTEKIRVKLSFQRNAYECLWVPTVDDTLVFADEICWFEGDKVSGYGEHLGHGHKESELPERGRIDQSIPGYGLKSLKNWKVYHFHDTSESAKVKKIGDLNDNVYLRPDAANLAAFLYRLRETANRHYLAIRDAVRLVAPFFDDFILRPLPQNEDKIRLEWRERGSDYPFLAHHLSDGTLRFACLATLLLQPEPPSTILIDEPELGLHPYAINTLASMMRSASHSAQVIVSTQSVTLVNQFEAEDLLVVELHDGATTIERLDAARLEDWLDEYSLGELWEKNVFGGRPAR
jgi:predicted ATPase